METALRITRSTTLSQRLFALCFVYSAGAFFAFPGSFVAAAGAHPITRYFIYVPVILFAGLVFAGFYYQPKSPASFIVQKLTERAKGAAIITATLVVTATAFTTLKHEYSLSIPFFADEELARIDQMLHFGDPWRYLHAILPAIMDYPLFILYSALWFIEVVLAIVVASMLAERFARERYFAALVVSVILLSSPLRILGSSAGPIFYDRIIQSDRFADLMVRLQANHSGADLMKITDYLYNSYSTKTVEMGTGIAAMPSLHVALAFLNALFAYSINRKAGVVAWIYFVIIQFGSVYFGWHYAIDGYVSIMVVGAIWLLATRLAAKSQGNPTRAFN